MWYLVTSPETLTARNQANYTINTKKRTISILLNTLQPISVQRQQSFMVHHLTKTFSSPPTPTLTSFRSHLCNHALNLFGSILVKISHPAILVKISHPDPVSQSPPFHKTNPISSPLKAFLKVFVHRGFVCSPTP